MTTFTTTTALAALAALAAPRTAETVEETAPDVEENSDFANFKEVVGGANTSMLDLFDKDFLHYCSWLRQHVHGLGYSRAVFRAHFRREAMLNFVRFALYPALFFVVRDLLGDDLVWLWGPAVLAFGVGAMVSEQTLHARLHWATDMSGCRALDLAVDCTMAFLTGVSREAFHRRHVDEHVTDIANVARVYGEHWLPFVDLPATWYARPFALLSLALSPEKQRRYRLKQRQLLIDCTGLFLFLLAMAVELVWFQSYFLLCFHMLPYCVINSARLLTGTLAHSGVDKINSFNSCGFFDAGLCRGELFSVTIKIINTLTDMGLSNHAHHHAYSQCPASLVNQHIDFLNKHVLETYDGVRMNRVLAHELHRDILARLPPPGPLDYVIQALVTSTVIGVSALTFLGINLTPTIFELALVDYRAVLTSTRAERCANFVALWDSLKLHKRAATIANPHAYLQYVLRVYDESKAYLARHPHPIPHGRRFAPDYVYDRVLRPSEKED